MITEKASEDYKSFIDRLRQKVGASGLTQSSIAQRCGWTPWQLSARLCLRQRVTVEDVPKLCKALGIGIGELFYTIEQ